MTVGRPEPAKGVHVLAAAPSIGRASAVEAPAAAREAELTHALYERYAHQLYGFCYAKLGSREEAEDAVQTTFLNAFRGLARGVKPQAESAWLFKIAENVCLSRHRSSFRRRRVESPSDLELLQDVVPAREHDGDELVGLEQVLERMPESQRRAILLREWQGLSYREIAEEMELTQAAVETLIFRARRSLAQGLASASHEDPERETLRSRVRRGADAGGLIAALKTFLGTALGMKTAATVVAVGSATMIAAAPAPLRHELMPGVRQARRPASEATVRPARVRPVASAVTVGAGRPAVDTPAAKPERRRRPVPAHLAARKAPTHPSTPVASPAATTAAEPAAPRPAAVTPAEPAPAEPAPTAAAPPPADATPTKDTRAEQALSGPPQAETQAREQKHGDGAADTGNGRSGERKNAIQVPAPVPTPAPAPSAPAEPAVPASPTTAPEQPGPADEAGRGGGNGFGKDKDR